MKELFDKMNGIAFTKYIWLLVSLTVCALVLALFHNADKNPFGVMDLVSILGNSATFIGVCIAIFEFKNWKKVKRYETKVDSLKKLYRATHLLNSHHFLLKNYLSVLDSNKGVTNPQSSKDKFSMHANKIGEHFDEAMDVVATEILLFEDPIYESFNHLLNEALPRIHLGNDCANKLLNTIYQAERTHVSVDDWTSKINTAPTLYELKKWLDLVEGNLEIISALSSPNIG